MNTLTDSALTINKIGGKLGFFRNFSTVLSTWGVS